MENPKPKPPEVRGLRRKKRRWQCLERQRSSYGAQSPLTTVPDYNLPEPVSAALPGGFFVANPDETQSMDLFGAVTSGSDEPSQNKGYGRTWSRHCRATTLAANSPEVETGEGDGGGERDG